MSGSRNIKTTQIQNTLCAVAILIFIALAIDAASISGILCSTVHAQQVPVAWADEQKQGARYFLESLNVFHLANDAALNKKEGAGNPSVLWKQSLEKSRLVKDDALEALHPDLKGPFKSFITGLEMLGDATGSDAEKMQRLQDSEDSIKKFAQWLNRHQSEIRLPNELDRPQQFSR